MQKKDVDLRFLLAMEKQEAWIGRCKCCLTWSKDKAFIAEPQLQSQLLPGERYLRCTECLKFYMDSDWLKRYMREDEERELFREQMLKSGHPLFQRGAKFAPRRAKGNVIELQQNKKT